MEAVTSKKLTSTKSLLDTLTSLKREIFSYLDQALEIDQHISQLKNSNVTSGAYDNAIILYEKSLSLTDEALKFYEKNSAEFSKNEEATKILDKLNSIKAQTLNRLKALQSETSKIEDIEFLNIGDEVNLYNDDDIIIIDDQCDHSKPDLNKPNDCVITDEKPPAPFTVNDSKKATEILRLDNASNMFFIGTDGSVSTPSSPKTISIYSFDQ